MMKASNLILVCVFIFSFLLVKNVASQSQKIGYIDSDIILQNMPEFTGIEQQLSLLSDNWESEVSQMEDELQELERDFEAREILFTDDVRQQRLREIDNLRNRIDQFIEDKFGPDGEYFTRQQELLEPVQRQIFEALTQVASRDAFDFVFDRADETRFLYVRQEWNLTFDVMLEMGLDVENLRN